MGNTRQAPIRPAGAKGYLGFSPGDLVVYCGKDVGSNLADSLKQVAHIQKGYGHLVGRIVYINLPFHQKRFLPERKKYLPNADTDDVFSCMNVPTGDLITYKAEIFKYVATGKYPVLVINSWEFSARNSRQRDDLIFFLQSIRNEFDVTIIIYSHSNTANARPGWYHGGGLGKLAVIADKIYDIGNVAEPARAEEAQVPMAKEEAPTPPAIKAESAEPAKIIQAKSEEPPIKAIKVDRVPLPKVFIGDDDDDEYEGDDEDGAMSTLHEGGAGTVRAARALLND